MKTACVLMVFFIFGCATQEMVRVRKMDIENVNVHAVQDGEYTGAFSYSGFEYRVKTIVSEHRIEKIVVLNNKKTRHAKRAEGVIPEIIEQQTPNVDAISGATTTSKALMKAVENSLKRGMN